MPPTFDELVAEGAAVPTEGWDFSWFEGRATEARPSWGYARTLAGRLAGAGAVLDVQTGGGEVLDFALRQTAPRQTAPRQAAPRQAALRQAALRQAALRQAAPRQAAPRQAAPRQAAPRARPPRLVVATEGWPPNVAKATRLLGPHGVPVVAAPDDAPLPFADGAFDLVVSRHPVEPHWADLARVLAPGGTYFAQHVGPASVFELVEFFLGPLPEDIRRHRHPERERAAAEAAGLEVVDLRAERLRMEFHDVGAVVHFLRKVVWMVPGFTVDAYRDRLRDLHERIRADGPFVAHSSRHLVELRRVRP